MRRSPLTPDQIITAVLQKYDQDAIQTGWESKSVKDKAFTATECTGSMGKAKDKKNVECYICHKTGHYKCDCWAKGRGKEGQSLRSKKWLRGKPKSESASIADDKAVEGAWMAMTEDSQVKLSAECDFV